MMASGALPFLVLLYGIFQVIFPSFRLMRCAGENEKESDLAHIRQTLCTIR
jgi:hypothetical protein